MKSTKIMSYLTLLTFLLLNSLTSCKENKNHQRSVEDRVALLEKNLNEINIKYKNSNDSLVAINIKLVKPFYQFQSILIYEPKESPITSITKYDELIRQYPNTYWAHESKRRISNIKKKSKYWSKKKGWNIPIDTNDNIIESCPGC